MKTVITGKNTEVTDDIRNRVLAKLSKLDKYDVIKPDTPCSVLFRSVKGDQIVEITIELDKKRTVRAEKRAKDFLTAIDSVTDAIEKQVSKVKDKTVSKKVTSQRKMSEQGYVPEMPYVVKEKTVELTRMTPEIAADEMEELDHDFHLYIDDKTGNVAVIYKRKDGNYGILYGE